MLTFRVEEPMKICEPPPPQHTNTISGFTPSSNISKAALIKKYIYLLKLNKYSTIYKKISS
jgi:hypothetical protein